MKHPDVMEHHPQGAGCGPTISAGGAQVRVPTQGASQRSLPRTKNLSATEYMLACSLSRIWLFVSPWTVAHQAPLSKEFSRQEHWSGLLFPSPGDLPNSGIKGAWPLSHALAGRFFTTELPGKPATEYICPQRKLSPSALLQRGKTLT